MISPNHAEAVVLEWTVLLGTIIFCAGYLWHHLKEAFPELFKEYRFTCSHNEVEK